MPSFLLKVDPKSFDADSLKSFDIEVILELEDGYILGASADAELTKLQEKIEKFIAEEHGGGKVAEIWEILEGKFKRLKYILSPDLLAKWDQILDGQTYTVDVSIACVGLNPKFSNYPLQKEEENPEKYARKIARWTEKRDQTIQEWDQLQYERECDFENFVRDLGGTFLLLGDHDDRSHLALLPDSFSSRIEISGRGLKDLVANYPYIFEVNELEQIAEPLTERNLETTDQPSFTLEPPSPLAPKVCVIDSGIQESHRLLHVAIDSTNSRSWVPHDTDTVDRVLPGGHGTRVAGAILYPQGVPRTGRQAAICWLQNARVLGQNCLLSGKVYMPEVLQDIVDFYHRQDRQVRTRIFNHSINSSAPCRTLYMSAWAAEIDYLSWQNDILFIVSAGNLPTVRLRGLSITRKTLTEHFLEGCVYPDFLLKDSSRIANPAQSFQALTVGSIAHCTYNKPPLTSVASQDYPSAFSCAGYGIWDSIKPEVVEYGGDWVQDQGNPPSFSTPKDVCPELIQTTMGGAPAIAADSIGTSFATPKVTHIAAALAANFPEESCLLYKALIVQSARLPEWTKDELDLSPAIRMMGYGLPNLERALGNAPHRVTLITRGDTFIQAQQAHIYQVVIPEELQSPAESFDILVEITLSYKAEPRRTRRDKRKYLSTWLHWECSEKGESPDSFLARVLKKSEVSDENIEESRQEIDSDGEGIFSWTIGQQKNHSKRVKDTSRGVGTIQKDWAIVKSFDLRDTFCIAVVAHKGWNNDLTAQIPYALAVSFEIINSEITIYDAFVQVQQPLQVQQEVRLSVS
ncbi:S8 family peptidase [Synechococcus sp. PCC 6312]|uniref:S8 family peptidase n=1 Tax=Synechococcus sp. (strain ATCC 27167 / PCC 6312) TaxID=195253 RepID=UPI00209ED241|nr:S8 family peptidase [Synechococcus sp. PCC 6312]